MSHASECDLCGTLTRADDAPGTISLDVHKNIDAEGTSVSWFQIELCAACTARVLAVILPAMNDFDDKEPDA